MQLPDRTKWEIKPVEIDPDRLTMRRVGEFRKAMKKTLDIEDDIEKMEAQAALLAGMTDNWTADELMDLPVSRFKEFSTEVTKALNGQIPNGNATGS